MKPIIIVQALKKRITEAELEYDRGSKHENRKVVWHKYKPEQIQQIYMRLLALETELGVPLEVKE